MRYKLEFQRTVGRRRAAAGRLQSGTMFYIIGASCSEAGGRDHFPIFKSADHGIPLRVGQAADSNLNGSCKILKRHLDKSAICPTPANDGLCTALWSTFG